MYYSESFQGLEIFWSCNPEYRKCILDCAIHNNIFFCVLFLSVWFYFAFILCIILFWFRVSDKDLLSPYVGEIKVNSLMWVMLMLRACRWCTYTKVVAWWKISRETNKYNPVDDLCLSRCKDFVGWGDKKWNLFNFPFYYMLRNEFLCTKLLNIVF